MREVPLRCEASTQNDAKRANRCRATGRACGPTPCGSEEVRDAFEIWAGRINEAQKCPSGEVPLVLVPVGTPGGHPSN